MTTTSSFSSNLCSIYFELKQYRDNFPSVYFYKIQRKNIKSEAIEILDFEKKSILATAALAQMQKASNDHGNFIKSFQKRIKTDSAQYQKRSLAICSYYEKLKNSKNDGQIFIETFQKADIVAETESCFYDEINDLYTEIFLQNIHEDFSSINKLALEIFQKTVRKKAQKRTAENSENAYPYKKFCFLSESVFPSEDSTAFSTNNQRICKQKDVQSSVLRSLFDPHLPLQNEKKSRNIPASFDSCISIINPYKDFQPDLKDRPVKIINEPADNFVFLLYDASSFAMNYSSCASSIDLTSNTVKKLKKNKAPTQNQTAFKKKRKSGFVFHGSKIKKIRKKR